MALVLLEMCYRLRFVWILILERPTSVILNGEIHACSRRR